MDSTSSAPTRPMLEETIRLPAEYVLAIHDFAPRQQDVNCLFFRAGQVIHVLNQDRSGWWDGELVGQRGWFPSSYVNAESDINSQTEEGLPGRNVSSSLLNFSIDDTHFDNQRQRCAHGHAMPSISAASRVSLQAQTLYGCNHRPVVSETFGSDVESYCPSLMLPLLQGISVLQSAVRSSCVVHLEISTACIISRIKVILKLTDCLHCESPLLRNFSNLSQERKALLADLAALIQETREAVSNTTDEGAREVVMEEMVKTARQVFAHTRRFLDIAVQCGVDLSDGSEFGDSTDTRSKDDLLPRRGITPTLYENAQLSSRTSVERRLSLQDHNMTTIPDSVLCANPRRSRCEVVVPFLLDRDHVGRAGKEHYGACGRVNGGHNSDVDNVLSTTLSGFREYPKPFLPPLPQKPCTAAQVMEVLRSTHDHYLSTSAAFIGHAHSYSRFSHVHRRLGE